MEAWHVSNVNQVYSDVLAVEASAVEIFESFGEILRHPIEDSCLL